MVDFGCLAVWLLFFVFIILLFREEREMMFSFKTRLASTWRNFSGVFFLFRNSYNQPFLKGVWLMVFSATFESKSKI